MRITLDEEQAERIRAHAELSGMSITDYLLSAAVHQMNADTTVREMSALDRSDVRPTQLNPPM